MRERASNAPMTSQEVHACAVLAALPLSLRLLLLAELLRLLGLRLGVAKLGLPCLLTLLLGPGRCASNGRAMLPVRGCGGVVLVRRFAIAAVTSARPQATVSSRLCCQLNGDASLGLCLSACAYIRFTGRRANPRPSLWDLLTPRVVVWALGYAWQRLPCRAIEGGRGKLPPESPSALLWPRWLGALCGVMTWCAVEEGSNHKGRWRSPSLQGELTQRPKRRLGGGQQATTRKPSLSRKTSRKRVNEQGSRRAQSAACKTHPTTAQASGESGEHRPCVGFNARLKFAWGARRRLPVAMNQWHPQDGAGNEPRPDRDAL